MLWKVCPPGFYHQARKNITFIIVIWLQNEITILIKLGQNCNIAYHTYYCYIAKTEITVFNPLINPLFLT